MPIKKYTKSPRDQIAYEGTTEYDCPVCKKTFETETIQIPKVNKKDDFEAALVNLPVLRLAIVEKPKKKDTLEVEIDYICEGCKLPIKLVRPLEN